MSDESTEKQEEQSKYVSLQFTREYIDRLDGLMIRLGLSSRAAAARACVDHMQQYLDGALEVRAQAAPDTGPVPESKPPATPPEARSAIQPPPWTKPPILEGDMVRLKFMATQEQVQIGGRLGVALGGYVAHIPAVEPMRQQAIDWLNSTDLLEKKI